MGSQLTGGLVERNRGMGSGRWPEGPSSETFRPAWGPPAAPLPRRPVGANRGVLQWYPDQELNLDRRFRKPLLYPFELSGRTRAAREVNRVCADTARSGADRGAAAYGSDLWFIPSAAFSDPAERTRIVHTLSAAADSKPVWWHWPRVPHRTGCSLTAQLGTASAALADRLSQRLVTKTCELSGRQVWVSCIGVRSLCADGASAVGCRNLAPPDGGRPPGVANDRDGTFCGVPPRFPDAAGI